MKKSENELGGYHVYVPEEARLNYKNKEETPPETKYEKRRANIEERVTKKLCGGKYAKKGND
jgi:hypothetical protein